MKDARDLIATLSGRKVLFITTKNIDYIRNTQELELLKEVAGAIVVIGSNDKSYFKRLVHVYRKLLFQSVERFDTTFIGFAPQLVLPFFWRKFKDTTVVIDFFISVYDTLAFDRAKFEPGSPLGRLCLKLDQWTLEHADEVICDTMAHGDYFIDNLMADENHMWRLFLRADSNIYFPRTDILPKADGIHRILYFGSILPLQGVEVILEAMERFANDPEYQFEIIGPIDKKKSKPEADNICYIDWLSQRELASHIAEADLCLAGHFNGTIQKASRTIPGKAYIYEAMDKPMILGDGLANHELFSADDKHIFVKMGDADALESAIRDYFNGRD